MNFRNRYLRFALMGQDDDTEEDLPLSRESSGYDISDIEYESPPSATIRQYPGNVYLGPDRNDVRSVDHRSFSERDEVLSVMHEINERIHQLNRGINEWITDVDVFSGRDPDPEDDGYIRSLRELIGEAAGPLYVTTLGSPQAIERYNDLIELANEYDTDWAFNNVEKTKRGAERDNTIFETFTRGDASNMIHDLIRLAGYGLARLGTEGEPETLKQLGERAAILAWLSRVLGGVSARDDAMKELRKDIENIVMGNYGGLSTSTDQYDDLLDLIKRRGSLYREIPPRGSGLYEGGSLATKAYQVIANQYRRRYCPGARMLEDGEIHPLCANWMGPGTNIREAMKYPSANAADECAKRHDLDYFRASRRTDPVRRADMIRRADEKIMRCMAQTNDYPYKQLGMMGIGTKMGAEDMIPQLTKMIMGKDTAANYFGKRKPIEGGCFGCAGDTLKCKGVSASLRVHTVSPFFVSG